MKIIIDRDLVEQALEALDCPGKAKTADEQAAITALKAALAEPVQEPVATVTECEACFTPDVCQLRGTCDYYTASQMRIAAPQQQAEPVQEPAAWRTFDGEGGWDYRDYENNEDYHKQWIERNGDRYAHWVEPLYNRVQKS